MMPSTAPDQPDDAPGGRPPVCDDLTTLADVKGWLQTFTDDRDWAQFHHPKELACALVCEVGEVMEHFRYKSHDRITADLADPAAKRELAHELADCLWAVVRLADVTGIDLSASLAEKLVLAAEKYPADLSRGRPDKYTAYQAARGGERGPG